MTEQNPTAPQAALLGAERRAYVLTALARDGVVRMAQLTEELDVAPVTLRRDFAQMEKEGLLVRVHGGAVAPSGGVTLPEQAVKPTTGTIAVLVPSLNYYWPGVIRGIEAEARRRGLTPILRGASYELQDERPVLERLVAEQDVRGFIVAPNTDTPHAQDVVQWLKASGLPSVFVERDAVLLPSGEPVENVVTDHALGAVFAARHLASLGHRKVGLILSRDSPTSRKIARGWDTACAELELQPSDHFEQYFPDRARANFSVAVDDAIDTALRTGVTGLLIHSDPEAMAFIDIALNRGLAVPRDLSVVAYDDEVAQLFTPGLTAVSPPRAAVGAAAVDLLARRLEDPTRPVHRVTLNPSLNVRQSTAAVRA
ncbi:MAG: transcriptional regulator [Microbacterium sp. SCN 70-200]|uniref:substrate-binding domain-containing protein n=1 Tax=unclassified Microbacterium TaxID=2609290 RepID=UPI00086A7437|nr:MULTISPECIES: substrate-binding domain-containing protein [unclassified Microbacterium]MBN9215406.1 DeoR/GlpR family transcriptional regulator [Microbacterium sp.]ODT41153.1 MAG: transcriptional regulator [Microbacterium sp. SCN 70-200]OJV79451.1 MAG: transcriptional regulator [Microbacterium sp. 70-16]